jgi:hypothetical protein
MSLVVVTRPMKSNKEPMPQKLTGRAGGAAARTNSPKEAANLLRLSMAKAPMRGDGLPYAKLGRSIRYSEGALLQWMKSHLRLSTS